MHDREATEDEEHLYRYFLSWRYLRVRRTNYIGIIGIFVGVGALILILSIMAGFLAESRATVRGSLSDVHHRASELEIADAGAVRGPDPRSGALASRRRWRHGAASLVRHHHVRRASLVPRRRTVFSHPRLSDLSGVHVVGIDYDGELQATEFRDAITRTKGIRDNSVANPDDPFAPPPEYEPTGRPLASVIVGEQLMRVLALERGDIIKLILPVPGEERGEIAPNDREFVIAGSFRSGENEVDLGRVFLDRRELMDFLGQAGEFSQILVRLNDYENEGQTVVQELRKSLSEKDLISGSGLSEVRTWEEFKQNLIGAIENEKTLMGIMLSLVLVVAGFTIFAILSMLVTEKRRDIGILAALGATPRGIMSLFLLIGCWDAIIGATTGAIAGIWMAVEIDPIERWLSETFHVQIFNRDVYLFDHIPSVRRRLRGRVDRPRRVLLHAPVRRDPRLQGREDAPHRRVALRMMTDQSVQTSQSLVLQARDIRKSFVVGESELEVLHGAHLDLRRGELLCLMGSSGAGKSTFLHILALLERPTEGQVLLDGTDAWALTAPDRARVRNKRIGFVFQFYHLIPELSAVENVILPGMIAHSHGTSTESARAMKARATDLLVGFGLEHRLTHRPAQLSGGERQRVAIARSLFLDPDVVIADEPTGNLDSATGEKVLDLLFEEQRKRQLSLLLVTHDERIAHFCERTLYMADGQIQADSGTPIPH